MRVLITGLPGFAGPYLAEHIHRIAPDTELFGLEWREADRQEHPSPAPAIRMIRGDVTDPRSARSVVETSRPDIVFHLAAASSVSGSWSDPAGFFQVNTVGTVQLLEAIRTTGAAATVVVASSADVYGRACDGIHPLTERLEMRPVSPYGASKAAMEVAAQQYFEGAGIPVIRLRLFNHTGPGRPPSFVASSLARQIALAEDGRSPAEIRVGNLEVVRDFTDVRDVACAYWLAATRGRPGEVYNVCSGRGTSVRDLLDRLLAAAGVEVEIREDRDRVRAADIPALVGDPTKLREATGWRPAIELETTLLDLLEYWRSSTSASRGC